MARHSFNKYAIKVIYILGMVLSAGVLLMNMTHTILAILELTVFWGKQNDNK